MFDLGDLREGYFKEEDLYKGIEEIIKLEGIKINRYRNQSNLLWRSNTKRRKFRKISKIRNKIKKNII